MSGTDTAAMVPGRYSVVIDGHGYVFWAGLLQSLPFRNQRAAFSYSNTFLERTNVGAGYGDDQQAFWMTASQNDWSGGQGQRFFHLNDKTTINKAARILQGDPVTIPGQVTMMPALQNLGSVGGSTLSPVSGCTGNGADAVVIAGSDAHLWGISSVGATTDHGAHGAGTVGWWGMCTDGVNVYIAGASKLRKWNGASFADFSAATSVGSIAYLNNALYSFDGSALYSYDTSGTKSSALYTWRDATGTAIPIQAGAKIAAFGGQLLIMLPSYAGRPQLWMWDGTSASEVADFSQSATVSDIAVIDGIVFIGGSVRDTPGGSAVSDISTVWYFANGTLDELWRAVPDPGAGGGGGPAFLGSYAGRLVFLDEMNNCINTYDLASGAIWAIADTSARGPSNTPFIASSPTCFVYGVSLAGGQSRTYFFPQSATFASTATVTNSLADFDSALPKIFHGVRVDWEGGGTVDIKYQIDSLSGNFSTLRTAAVSGTEYTFSANTAGHAVAVQVVLNNSSGNIPTLKRWYLRASPLLTSFRRCQYVLDLTGRADRSILNNPVPLLDGTDQTLTGSQMAANLVAAITSTAPISITDEFGTYTAVAEQGEGITELDEVRPGEFIAQTTWREV